MAPRIIESDYEDDDEIDELASDSSATPAVQKAQPVASTSASVRGSARIRTNEPTAPAPTPASSAKQRPGRQAAQRANETMEVDSPMEDDEEEEDELAQYPQQGGDDDDDEDEEEEDAASETFLQDEEDEEQDEDDEEDEGGSPPASAAPVKIKLKLGGAKGPSSVMSASFPVPARKAAAKASKASKKGKSKAAPAKAASKRKREEYEGEWTSYLHGSRILSKLHTHLSDPSLMDMDGEDEGEDVPIPDEDDEELDFLSDDSNKSDVSFSKMTARQRAAHVGDDAALMELPSGELASDILFSTTSADNVFHDFQRLRRRRC